MTGQGLEAARQALAPLAARRRDRLRALGAPDVRALGNLKWAAPDSSEPLASAHLHRQCLVGSAKARVRVSDMRCEGTGSLRAG